VAEATARLRRAFAVHYGISRAGRRVRQRGSERRRHADLLIGLEPADPVQQHVAHHPYNRTAAELMVEAAAQMDYPNYPTSRGEVVQWFAEHCPQVKASTIRAHIVGLTANDRSRHHYSSLARREPLFAPGSEWIAWSV
jgi:hypothetical protein